MSSDMEALPTETTRKRSRKQAVAIVVMLLAAVLIGGWLYPLLPDPEEVRDAPYSRQGKIGEPVEFRLGTVKVNRVRGADQLGSFMDVAGTNGLWLVFDIELSPKKKPASIGEIQILDTEGRLYGGFQPISTGCHSIQPGLTALCEMAIEVPLSALEGAKLHIPTSPQMPDGPDDRIEIDLEIDAKKAKQLKDSATRINVYTSNYVRPS